MPDVILDRQIDLDAGEFEFRAADDGDGLTITGYIARFDDPVEILDQRGHYMEELARGAFANTLAARGAAKIKMQFDHGKDPMFGTLPIGTWTELTEDRKGLLGRGRIHDTWHTIPIRAAIESGALSGMSFKMKVIGEQNIRRPGSKGMNHFRLTEVALFEAGPVVYPAYQNTTVAVRSLALGLFRDAVDLGESVATLRDETAVAPVGDTDPETRTVADPPVGITRRDMRIRALTALGVIPDEPDRGAA